MTTKQLLLILTKSLPINQATIELNWIRSELPESKWLEAVNRRSQLQPLQYILGMQPFLNFDIQCKPGVLIPRNDTEEWCSELIETLNDKKVRAEKKFNVLDYCSGSGCISLGMTMLNDCKEVIGIDFNEKAVELGKLNYENHKDIIDTEVNFVHGDIMKLDIPKSPTTFDLLISNPPYIPIEDMCQKGGVEESVLKYEPKEALVGHLEFYQQLVKLIPIIRAKAFVFELGYLRQAVCTQKLLSENWLCGIRYDSGGRIRNVIGWSTEEFAGLRKLCHEMI